MNHFYRTEHRHHLLMIWGVTTALLLVVLPISWQYYRGKQITYNQYQQDIASQKWYEIYQEMKEEKAAKANYLNSLDSRLYYEEESHRFFEGVQQVASQSGVEIQRFQPGQMQTGEIYQLQHFQVYIHGDYWGVVHFIQQIVQIPHQKVEFTISPEGGRLLCSLEWDVYVKPGEG